ncbi:MAG TPA: hypothetical protein VG033_01455 [Candidatus Acidoferrales bacterium]|jgi:hypothetical protein|nr:hypothetical protein [Candidatus Acidoferrales bacterium]
MIRRIVAALMTLTAALLLPGLLNHSSRSQAASFAGPPTQEKESQAPAMPKPGPETDRLKFLLGTWDYKGEYAKSAMLPDGGKEAGWYKAQLGPGGFSIIADFEVQGPLGPEIGHQMFVWDPKESAYKIYTVGNFPGIVIGTARWDGANLVTNSEFGEGAGKMKLRSVYTNILEKSINIEESFSMGDAPYQPLMKAVTTKK